MASKWYDELVVPDATLGLAVDGVVEEERTSAQARSCFNCVASVSKLHMQVKSFSPVVEYGTRPSNLHHSSLQRP